MYIELFTVSSLSGQYCSSYLVVTVKFSLVLLFTRAAIYILLLGRYLSMTLES